MSQPACCQMTARRGPRFGRLTLSLGLLAALGGLGHRSPAAAGGSAWPQWRGPRRDGISHEAAWQGTWPSEGPKRLWTARLGKGLAAVAVVDGRLFTLGNAQGRDTVWCLRAADGTVLWSYSYPSKLRGSFPGPAATPTVDGDRVYTHGREGDLLCLRPESGEVLWARNVRKDFGVRLPRPDYGNACSPLVVGERLIVEVGAPEALVVAFQKHTGEVAWTSGRGGELAYSSPVAFPLKGETRVAVFHAFGLGVLDPATGKELWRYPWRTHDRCSVATPIVSGDRVFISAAYGEGGALLQVGRDDPLWKTAELKCHISTCVLWKGFLYGFHGDRRDKGELRCVDFATGEVRWSHGGLGKGTVLVAGGRLIVLSQRGELLVAEAAPEGFAPTARARVLTGLCWTVPVLCNGRLFCRNHPGELVCLDLAGER